MTVAEQAASEKVTVTGHIEAENEAALGFRSSGRVIERSINVGDRVAAGQLLGAAQGNRVVSKSSTVVGLILNMNI